MREPTNEERELMKEFGFETLREFLKWVREPDELVMMADREWDALEQDEFERIYEEMGLDECEDEQEGWDEDDG